MSKKYEFTGETKEANGVTLHRIRAIRDFGDVQAGDVGGWIEKESNLSHEGLCWVYEKGRVYGNGHVYGNGRVSGNGCVYGNGHVNGDGHVYGNGCVNGDGRVSGNGRVFGNGRVSGNGRVYGNGCVNGDGHVYGNGCVNGDGRVFGNGCVSGNGCVYGNGHVSDNGRVSSGVLYVGYVTGEFSIQTQIVGTRHTANCPDGKTIRIGCMKDTPEWWLDNYQRVGEEEGYSTEQIAEYGEYIRLFAKLIEAKEAQS